MTATMNAAPSGTSNPAELLGQAGPTGKARGMKGQFAKAEKDTGFGALLQRAASDKGPKGAKGEPAGKDATAGADAAEPGKAADRGAAKSGAEPLATLEALLADKSDPAGGGATQAGPVLDAAAALIAASRTAGGEGRSDGRRDQASPAGRAAAPNATVLASLSAALAEATRKADVGTGPAVPDDADLDIANRDMGDLASILDGEAPPADRPGQAGSDRAAKRAEPFSTQPVKISVINQETYLPPALRASVMAQIAGPVGEAAAELGAAAAETGSAIEAEAAGPAGGIRTPTKVLHLALNPVELGSLIVKLRLVNERMEMRIEASNPDTATMLANDEATLREVVRASGYEADSIVVETGNIDQPGFGRSGSDASESDREAAGQDRDQSRDRGNPFGEPGRGDGAPGRDQSSGRAFGAADPFPGSNMDEPHDAIAQTSPTQPLRPGERRLYL